jgi:hypothetical protein
MSKMVETLIGAETRFLETCQAFSQIQQQAEGTDYQEYMEEFTQYLRKLGGQQLFGSVKLGNTAIAREMVGSPYPPPSPPPAPPEFEPTLLGRLFIRRKNYE